MEIIITIKNDDDMYEKLSNSKNYHDEVLNEPTSMYVKFFDENNPNYVKNNREFNLMFLKRVQTYCNDRLKAKGFLFLNDVLDELGFAKSGIGQIVGWLHKDNNLIGDNYVDFDIDNDRNAGYLNGTSDVIKLDFNVDGCILDQI